MHCVVSVGNTTGSWMFWNVLTKRLLRRSNWIKMVMTELVIRAVDTIAVEEDADAESNGLIQDDVEVPDPPIIENVNIDMDIEEATQREGNDEDVDEEEANIPHEPAALRRSARIGAGVAPPERIMLVTKIKEADWDKEEETSKAVKCELKQLFH